VTGPIAQRLQIQLGSAGSPLRSFAYSLRPVILSDCDKGPQGAPRSCVPFQELNPVNTDKTPRRGRSSTPKSVEQSLGSLYKPTRPDWPATLSAFRRSSSSDPATYFKTDHVARSPVAVYNDSDTTVPFISTVPPVAGVHDIASQELFHLLVQKVYRALCFDPSGSFRSCGGSLSDQNLAPTAGSDQAPTTNRKRRLQGNYDKAQNKPGDNDRKSSRTTRSRVKPRTLGALLQEFACLFCKRNFDYGYEARCIGWSNSSIDEVLRVSGLLPLYERLHGPLPRHQYADEMPASPFDPRTHRTATLVRGKVREGQPDEERLQPFRPESGGRAMDCGLYGDI
jgi:hypothetical protein